MFACPVPSIHPSPTPPSSPPGLGPLSRYYAVKRRTHFFDFGSLLHSQSWCSLLSSTPCHLETPVLDLAFDIIANLDPVDFHLLWFMVLVVGLGLALTDRGRQDD